MPGMTRRSAQRLWSLSKRLRSLPVCARAYADGVLSGGQVEAIVALLDDEVVEVFAAQEAELVPYLAPLTVAGVSRAMAAWLIRARPEPTEPTEPDRSLHLSRTLDDRWILDGALDPEGGALLAAALRLALPDQAKAPGCRLATRRADALVDICRFFLDHQRSHPAGRHRPHLNVVVGIDDLQAGRGGRIIDGPGLDGPSISRLFCDSALHRVVMAGRSSILDYGTATRTVPGQPGTRLLPPPPRPAPTRLAGQAQTRRHLRSHRPRRRRPLHVTAAGRDPLVMFVGGVRTLMTATRSRKCARRPPLARSD